jgi:hypothetical protein
MIKKIPGWAQILLIFLVFGLLRSPFESRLRKEMTTSGMLLPTPGHTAFANLGQSALIGVLGGLRTLVATAYWLESFRHFENDEWNANRQALLLATYLEPTQESHWVALVWHRGINAPAWLERRAKLPEIEKKILFHEYTRDAIALGEAGLQQLPASVEIRKQMAQVYQVKINDPCGVAKLYGEIMKLPNAPVFAKRFYGYFLADCPGQKQPAYDHLYKLYWESEKNHLPTLIKKILVLQEELKIPTPLWIRERDPDLPQRAKSRITLRKLPGGIVIP